MTGADTPCGLCGINDPYMVAAGYEASIVADRTPSNPEWRQLGPARQAILEQLVADGLTARHHQCCVIALLNGADYCIGCAASRAASRRR